MKLQKKCWSDISRMGTYLTKEIIQTTVSRNGCTLGLVYSAFAENAWNTNISLFMVWTEKTKIRERRMKCHQTWCHDVPKNGNLIKNNLLIILWNTRVCFSCHTYSFRPFDIHTAAAVTNCPKAYLLSKNSEKMQRWGVPSETKDTLWALSQE